WHIGTVQRACFELLFWTAARTVDAVSIGPQHVNRDDGVLVFSQSKTGGKAHVPWFSTLPDYASTWLDDRDMMHESLKHMSGGLTFLQTANGKSRSVKGLGNMIRQAAQDAGLTGRSAHGLRKSRLTLIAEHGGSAHAIMAWGGHKTLAEAQKYTSSAQLKFLVTGTKQKRNEVNRSHISVNFRKNN
ncbi:tyrosine-type recombinase/integrase, partial [Paracoccus seriniphilus]|uniref:tyrosine-type recombinase/integrase n=1 Tax=Paracoccus seriniphilus TaxID=184748 RepID=UPI0035613B66